MSFEQFSLARTLPPTSLNSIPSPEHTQITCTPEQTSFFSPSPRPVPFYIKMCEITCNLYRECSHHNRILVLCPAKQVKCLQQYNQYLYRQERQQTQVSEKPAKSSFWSCFCSSSAETDPIPRPLLRPATQFVYTTLEPPKIAKQYSCRASKTTNKTSTHWSACPDCIRAEKAQARSQARYPARSHARPQQRPRQHPQQHPQQRPRQRPQERPKQLPQIRTQHSRY